MKGQDKTKFLNRLADALGSEEGYAVFRVINRELDVNSVGLPGNETVMTEEKISRFEEIVSGIELGAPLQYLLGKADFYGLEILVNPSVLIPRPETEELVAEILKTSHQQEKRILDLGTGSGCIAIALSKLGQWKSVSALDLSIEALETARQNAEKYGQKIHFFQANILEEISNKGEVWDILVSNPPYVLASEASTMENRVLKHEPHLALFVQDSDPLIFYRKILESVEKNLSAGGEIFLEINPLEAANLLTLYLEHPSISNARILKDMFGKDRFLYAVAAG